MNEAEQVDSGITLDNDNVTEEINEESVPQLEEAPEVEKPEEPAEELDGVQKRINKITFDKHEEQRRADKLQAELDELKAKQPATTQAEPKLEDYDYDEQAYNSALISYKVKQTASEMVSDQRKLEQERQAKIEQEKVTANFNEKVAVFAKDKPDYVEAVSKIPILQPSVLDGLMRDENGAELVYHLANNLDVADQIVNMNPINAMYELGKISSRLSKVEPIKPSSAPDPIEPLKSNGITAKDRGPEGATFE